MDALDTQPTSADRASADSGTAADNWFQALDGRTIQIGTATCLAQVLGIHGGGSELWIQLASAENPDLSVVLHVGPATRIDQVIDRLATEPPQGLPLEVLSIGVDVDPVH